MNFLHKIQGKLWIVSLPLAIGLVWLVVDQVGWKVLYNALDNFSLATWVFAFSFTVIELYFQLLRSWIFLRCDNPALKYGETAKAGLAAFSAGSFTPGRIGDSALVLLLPKLSPRSIGLSLVDRLMFWPPMHMFGAISLGILFFPTFGNMGVVISIVVVVVYIVAMEVVFHRTRHTGEPNTSKKFLREMYHGFAMMPKKVWRIGILLGFCQYFAIMIQFVIGLSAIGFHGSLFDAAVIFGALQLFRSFLAFTPGNLGISEVVGMKLGEYAGMSADVLPQVTFPFFVINTVIPALVGFPLWIAQSRKFKRISE
ncbi:MAG: flippase-like domain-containing protein [bacterium]|nr:flippase-like domain-containing protein [bacterium]